MEKKQNLSKKQTVILLVLIFLAFAMIRYAYHAMQVEKFGVLNKAVLVDIPVRELPENTLYITPGRWQYQRGTMTLIIPAIDVYTPSVNPLSRNFRRDARPV